MFQPESSEKSYHNLNEKGYKQLQNLQYLY